MGNFPLQSTPAYYPPYLHHSNPTHVNRTLFVPYGKPRTTMAAGTTLATQFECPHLLSINLNPNLTLAPRTMGGLKTGGNPPSQTCGAPKQHATSPPNANHLPPPQVVLMSKLPSSCLKQLRMWQQNVHNSQTAQDYVRTTVNPKDWDVIAIQEPWLDSVGNSHSTQYW